MIGLFRGLTSCLRDLGHCGSIDEGVVAVGTDLKPQENRSAFRGRIISEVFVAEGQDVEWLLVKYGSGSGADPRSPLCPDRLNAERQGLMEKPQIYFDRFVRLTAMVLSGQPCKPPVVSGPWGKLLLLISIGEAQIEIR